MSIPPVLAALIIPAGLFAAWLFLHKDADVEQRIEKREAIHAIESAEFDKDFAKITGDKKGELRAELKIDQAEIDLQKAKNLKTIRGENDQRSSVREGVDEFLKPGKTK